MNEKGKTSQSWHQFATLSLWGFVDSRAVSFCNYFLIGCRGFATSCLSGAKKTIAHSSSEQHTLLSHSNCDIPRRCLSSTS